MDKIFERERERERERESERERKGQEIFGLVLNEKFFDSSSTCSQKKEPESVFLSPGLANPSAGILTRDTRGGASLFKREK